MKLLVQGRTGTTPGQAAAQIRGQPMEHPARGEPACGSCVAERALVWPEELAQGWARPANAGHWADRQFNQFAPERHAAFLKARNACDWTPPCTLAQHNARYRSLRGRGGRSGTANKTGGHFPTSVCVLPEELDVNGLPSQMYVTRVGPMNFEDAFPRSSDSFDVYPAAPAGDTYMVASLEALVNASSKMALPYPPLHTHHASSKLVRVFGGNPEPSEAARAISEVEDLVSRQFEGQAYGQHGPVAFLPLRQSMRHADFAGCVEGVADENACAFLAMPPGLGWPVPDGSATMSYSHYENVDPSGNLLGKVYAEVARQYTPFDVAIAPVVVVDFAVTGDYSTYSPAATNGPDRAEVSLGWRVFTLPRDGPTYRFHGSWSHSHAARPSEHLVFQGDVEDMLPRWLVTSCYSVGTCRQDLRNRTRGIYQRDMGLEANQCREVLQELMRKSNGENALRCQYKTRNAIVDGEAYTRSALRARSTAALCDRWEAQPGTPVSVLAINHRIPEGAPYHSAEAHKQHHQWYASVQLVGS